MSWGIGAGAPAGRCQNGARELFGRRPPLRKYQAVDRLAFFASLTRRWEISLYYSIPFVTGLALVQSVWLSRVSLWGARPDLVMLVVFAWAVARGLDEGLVWGFVGGLVIDLLSGGAMGVYTLTLLVVALLAGQSWGEGLGSLLARLLLLALVCSVAYHLVLLLALSLTGREVDWGFAVVRVATPSIVLNVLLAPFVWQPLAWLERRIRREGLSR